MSHLRSILDFSVGPSTTSTFEYFDGRVKGSPALNTQIITAEEFADNVKSLIGWREGLRISRPIGTDAAFPSIILSEPYSDEMSKGALGVVKWELQLGSLEWEVQWDGMEYTLTRSEFDISWDDFQYFVHRFNIFHALNVEGRFNKAVQ